MKILLLTKNLIADLEFQIKLQQLDYEVFSSQDTLNQLLDDKSPVGLQEFNLVILSETIPNKEVELLCPLLHLMDKFVIRKSDNCLEDQETGFHSKCDLDGWIDNAAPKHVLREQLIDFTELTVHTVQQDAYLSNSIMLNVETFKASLTVRERKFFETLFESIGKCVTRQELSEALWPNQKIANEVVSLNGVVRNIRKKLKMTDLVDFEISNKYSHGYILKKVV